MKTETTELAEYVGEIKRWHTEAERLASGAIEGLREALEAGANCGDAILDWLQENKGAGLAELRDVLPHGQAKKYVMLAKVRKDRGALPTDTQLLRALPLFDPHHEGDEQPQLQPSEERSVDRFVRSASKLIAILSDWTSRKPLAKWTRSERDAALAHLRPIHELYEELMNL